MEERMLVASIISYFVKEKKEEKYKESISKK